MAARPKMTVRKHLRAAYRSGLEVAIAAFLATERVVQWGQTVSQAMTNLSKGLSALFGGDRSGAENYFKNFGMAGVQEYVNEIFKKATIAK